MRVIPLFQQKCASNAGRIIGSPLLRQLNLGQPEIDHALDERREGIPLRGLAEIVVHLQLIASCDIRFELGSGQDDRGNRFQFRIRLDEGEHLAAIHFGEIEVEQDEIGTRCVNMDALAPQKSHGLNAVRRHV